MMWPGQENGDMPLHHAVLALLAAKPAHGYALKGSFEEAVGEQWGGLNIGHLYQILDRLARDGLVESQRQPQPVKPDRLVYRITPAGRVELDRWLDEPSVRTRGYRDDFFLKVMTAAQAGDPAALAAVLRRQRVYLLTELRSLAAARAAAARSPVMALLVTAAELHVRADLGVVEAAERDLTPGVLADLRISSSPAAASPEGHADTAPEEPEDTAAPPGLRRPGG
jgi:DNA-binding PadR family transcriptional regulator